MSTIYKIFVLLYIIIGMGTGIASAVVITPPSIVAPPDNSSEATSLHGWFSNLRYASTMQQELDKFTNLTGVYSGHTHETTNVTMMNNGKKVLYSTIETLYNHSLVDYISINGSNLDYRIVNITSTGVNSKGQLKFIVVGDQHLHATGYPDRNAALTQAVNFINNKSDVDFAVFIGDIASDALNGEFDIAKNILGGMKKPYYIIPGNHDKNASAVIEYADSIRNWISSDSANTSINTENNIKQEGFGSLKITTGSGSLGNTVIADIQPKNLSGHKYIEFWIRSNVSNTIKAGFGENNITENKLTVNINKENTWQKVRWNIDGIANTSKDAVTKFGFTITEGKPADIYIDNIIAQLNTNYEDHFGPKTKTIDNVKGYQLLFIGIWVENIYTQKGLKEVYHWDFDFDNSSINKDNKTIVFIHGPVQTPFDKINLGEPTVTPGTDPNPIVTNNFPVDFLPIGKNVVIWNVTDTYGNYATDIQNVTVTDSKAPVIEAPANITIKSKGLKTNIDLGEPIVRDLVDTNPTITNNAPIEGFPNGTTKVIWTARDKSGNSKTDTQYITILTGDVGDTIPPASITSLVKKSYGINYINWTWVDPKDIDFNNVTVYINGIYKEDVPKGRRYYNATGLIPYTNYKISTHTVDTSGNVNKTWKNLTSKTAKDSTFPASITDLKNITYARTYINWTWKDPSDIDFAKVGVYINGVYKTSVSKGKQYYKPIGLLPGTSYTISTRTVDTSGNINQTWANNTARTAP